MGDAVVCNDGVDCTVDTCETEVGCAIVADDLRCDDDDPCTDNICTETGCENVAKPDGSMCFFDESCGGVGICIEQGCVVVDSPDGTPCNDDEICTEQDVCQAGVCIGLLPEEPPTGLRLSELVPASATVSDFNTCSDEQPVQVQQLLAVEVDDVGSPSHTKFIWAGQPLSPQGGSCTQRGSWPVQLLNQGPVDENADRDGAPADEAPVPDVFPEPLSCQTPILLTTMMPQAPDPTPGEPWEADVEPDPDTFSHVLTWVDAKYLLKVVDSDLGKRIVVVHVNESHLGREPRVEVFNLAGWLTNSAPLNANFKGSNLAMVQDPVTHELTLVVAPRQRTYCHFCEPGPPPPPSGITQWPPMEWPVFRFSLPLPNSRVFPGDIVDDDTQFVLGPTTALYVNRKTTGEDPPMALLNIDHMAVLQQEGALAVAGEFSVHDEGEHRQPLFVTGLYDDVGNRYMAYDHSMLTGFGLVNPQLLATENYVEDGVVRLLSQFDRGCGYTDDELCIPRRVVTSGSDIIAEHDPSTMPTFGFAALSSDTVLQSTFTEVQRVQENVVETVAVLQGPGRQFYGPPRVSLDGAAHQQTEEGRANCRDRQRRHRAQGKEKREAVTHQGSEKSHAEKRSEKPRKGTIKQKKAEPIVGIAIVVIELKAKKNAKLSLIRVPKNLILP